MDDTIRCFIAVELPVQVLKDIGAYLAQLRKIAPEIRWVRPESMHITLKFLGEQPAALVESVAKKMVLIKDQFSPFSLSVTGSGCFPNRRQPRVFWLGMEQDKSNPLISLHEWIDNQMESLGFEKEKRRFSPHLTLGRIKQARRHDEIFKFFDQNPFSSDRFFVDRISLMRSQLKTTGAVYTALNIFPF